MAKLVKEQEISEQFGIPIPTLRADRIRERRIPFIKIGRSVRYDPVKVAATLDKLQVGGRP